MSEHFYSLCKYTFKRVMKLHFDSSFIEVKFQAVIFALIPSYIRVSFDQLLFRLRFSQCKRTFHSIFKC